MNDKLKLPYEVVSQQWDKMYAKQFPEGTDEKVIAKYCEDIADFVEACGWTVEEFMEEYIHRELKDIFPNPNPKDMN